MRFHGIAPVGITKRVESEAVDCFRIGLGRRRPHGRWGDRRSSRGRCWRGGDVPVKAAAVAGVPAEPSDATMDDVCAWEGSDSDAFGLF